MVLRCWCGQNDSGFEHENVIFDVTQCHDSVRDNSVLHSGLPLILQNLETWKKVREFKNG